ncbi:hypothetical protein Glove_736g5 [Diversispora epigaea]|uniref:Uncharacterized protein n=1 Tax=Diversispora epigaea TaxID=1348612 RepID=A0A397FZZ4_9GLOM|nr:hypothetical protein Glove_736g5 [Diversispora epigaea]
MVRLNFKSYCDIETKDINLPDHQRVVCQIKSLHHIINKCKCEKKCKCSPIPYDLWLNEVVSVNNQAHTRLAGRIIVMDNDLTDLNIEWIKSLRKGKQFSVIHNTYQPQKGSNSITLNSQLQISPLVICHLRKDIQGIVRAFKTDFSELHIKEYHGDFDPVEKMQNFSNIEEAWKDVDIHYYIETNAGTNQMLFRMKCIKKYTCHIEQKSSNFPITEQGLFYWLLKAKCKCLSQELQNREVFPDVESII